MISAINIAIAIIIGGISAFIAQSRGRSPLRWFFIGLLLGFIGVIALFIMPSMQKEEQEIKQDTPPPPPSTQNNWFYLDKEKNIQGPLSLSVLKNQWNKGELTAKSWVWNESLNEWKKIEDMPVLFQWINMSVLTSNT